MQENRFPEDWQQEEQIKEEKGRSPWTSLIIGLLAIVAILTVFTFFILNKEPKKQPQNNLPQISEQNRVQNQIEISAQQIYYKGCGHIIVLDQVDENLAKLDWHIPEHMGWTLLAAQENGGYVIGKEEDGLCPEDQTKRHLVIYSENELASYAGTAGMNGELIRTYQMDWQQLPQELQEQLQGDGMNFADEEDLLQALDSFDEYL